MFPVQWELQFFFAENIYSEPECMICYRTVSVRKKYNIERHYNTCHSLMHKNLNETQRRELVNGFKKTFLEKNSKRAVDQMQKASSSIVVSLNSGETLPPTLPGWFIF